MLDAIIIYLLIAFSVVIPISVRRIVMSEAQAAVDAVVAQLGKAHDEIVRVIEELKSREPDVDVSALEKIAQVLDDVVPDAPVEEPVEEAPVEEPVEEEVPVEE